MRKKMSVLEKRWAECEQKAVEYLKSTIFADNPDSRFGLCIHLDKYRRMRDPELYEYYLKMFKALFASEDPDIRIALWNAIATYNFDGFPPRKDFSKEEYVFLKERIAAAYDKSYNLNDSIYTERLILRPVRKEDVKLCARHLKEEEDFFTCFGLKPTRENIESVLYECANLHGALCFAIEEKNTLSVVGFVNLCMHPPAMAELKYYVFKEYRRNGYCREAVSALTEKALRGELFGIKDTVLDGVWDKKPAEIGLIRAEIPETNEPALNAIRSCGFIHEATRHKSFLLGKNRYISEEVFYKTRDEGAGKEGLQL